MSLIPSGPVDASGTARGLVNLAAQSFAGVKTFLATLVASVGIQVGSLFNTNGSGASDVAVTVGTSLANASVSAAAKLLSVRTGINGTEVEYVYVTKGGFTFASAGSSVLKWDAGGGNSWQIEGTPGTGYLRIGNNTVQYFGCRLADGFAVTSYGFEVNPTLVAATFRALDTGRVDQAGTDSSGTPGAATINKPCGISAIAIGASSVVITNSLATTTSHISITPLARDTTCKELAVTARGAGSFTVSGTANATAALAFAWEVKTLL